MLLFLPATPLPHRAQFVEEKTPISKKTRTKLMVTLFIRSHEAN